MWNEPLIVSNSVGNFVKDGGALEYKPIMRGKKTVWELWAVTKNSKKVQVISSQTGEPRIFKSADSLLSFHCRTFPDQEGFFLSSIKTISVP